MVEYCPRHQCCCIFIKRDEAGRDGCGHIDNECPGRYPDICPKDKSGYVIIDGNANIFCSNRKSLNAEIDRALSEGKADFKIMDEPSYHIMKLSEEPKPVFMDHKGWHIERIDAGFSTPGEVYFMATKRGEDPITAPTYTAIIGFINLREGGKR